MNIRTTILPDNHSLTVTPLKQLIRAIHDFLPDGNYADLSEEQIAIAAAGIYINEHRLPEAIQILNETLAKSATNRQWISDLVSAIEAAEKLPGTKQEDLAARREQEETEWKRFRDKVETALNRWVR